MSKGDSSVISKTIYSHNEDIVDQLEQQFS